MSTKWPGLQCADVSCGLVAKIEISMIRLTAKGAPPWLFESYFHHGNEFCHHFHGKQLQKLHVGSHKVLVGAHALIFENSAAGLVLMMSLQLMAWQVHRYRQDIQVFTANKCAEIVDKACQARAREHWFLRKVPGQHLWPRDGRVQCVSLPQAFAKYRPYFRLSGV